VKVFVTGGNGFIGSVVVRRLVHDGHEVRCLLRETSRTARIDDLPIERALGDVRDIASLRSAMMGCDCTIHLAAPGGWEADAAATNGAIIEQGTRNVLAAAEKSPTHRVVFVSSTAAIAASDTPRVFDERAPFSVRDPALAYAHAKHRAELVAMGAYRHGANVVIVNPSEVYGPGDVTMNTAGNLVDFATSVPALVCRGGTSIVHVDDVANGIIAALRRGRSGQRYILGGDNVTIRELARLVLDIVGRRVPIVTMPTFAARPLALAAMRTGVRVPFNPVAALYATYYWFMDSTKARMELGVTFRDARATIASTIDWLRQAGHLN
jgi:dihydroflavonol-4-reductase